MKSAKTRRSVAVAVPRRIAPGPTIPMVAVEAASRPSVIYDASMDEVVQEAAIESSWFVVAAAGGAGARDLSAGWGDFLVVAPGAEELAVAVSQVGSDDRPRWDAKKHTLFWQGACVKRFTKQAPVESAILDAFARSRWRHVVAAANVRLPDGRVCPKLCLRNAVRNLNRCIRPHLRIRQEQDGAALRWEKRVATQLLHKNRS